MSEFTPNHKLPKGFDLENNGRRFGALMESEIYPKVCAALTDLDGIELGDALLIEPKAALEWTELSKTEDGIKKFAEENIIIPRHYDPTESAREGKTLREHCEVRLRNGFAESPGDVGAQYGEKGLWFELVGDRFSPFFDYHEEDVEIVGKTVLKAPVQYYWDSLASNRGMGNMEDGNLLMRRPLEVFRRSTERFNGNIPNSTTKYAEGRSQQPVLASMIRHLARIEGDESVLYDEYLPTLERHYNFWNEGIDDPNLLKKDPGSTYNHLVRMPGGEVLYRFHDSNGGPRPEMYMQDLETAEEFKEFIRQTENREPDQSEVDKLYDDIRAAAENGEDFTLHLTSDGKNLFKIHTTDIVSSKLASAMFDMSSHLSFAYYRKYQLATDPKTKQDYYQKHEQYSERSVEIAEGIRKYFIALPNKGIACDYDYMTGESKPPKSLSAAIWPLASGAVGLIEDGQKMLDRIDEIFYRPKAGLVNTTYENSDQQWDNVWPLPNLVAADAAIQYGRYDLADKWITAYLDCQERLLKKYGKLFEKGTEEGEVANDGEYECVADLRMTLGVTVALLDIQGDIKTKATEQLKRQKEGRLKAGEHIGLMLMREAKANDAGGS